MVIRIGKELLNNQIKLVNGLLLKEELSRIMMDYIQMYNGEKEGRVKEKSIYYIMLCDFYLLEKIFEKIYRILVKEMSNVQLDEEINMFEYYSLYKNKDFISINWRAIMNICVDRYNHQKDLYFVDGNGKPIFSTKAEDSRANNTALIKMVNEITAKSDERILKRKNVYDEALNNRIDFWQQLYELSPDVFEIYEGDKVQIVSGAGEILAEL